MFLKNFLFQKICATVTAVCFFVMINTNVFASATVSPSQNSAAELSKVLETAAPVNINVDGAVQSLISDKYGKVIAVNNNGSDTLVINIQDLHCDYFAQKNIYGIIDELCSKYSIEKVFVEGGIGTPDISFLSSLKPEYKKTVLENLLKSGRLTAAEYYSALNDKKGFLKGVEDEKLYKQNIVRLSEILKAKSEPETKQVLSNIDRELDFLQAKHFGSGNKKFTKLLNKYETNKISQAEFLSQLFKFAEKNKINTSRYKNLKSYLALSSASGFDKKKLTKEFSDIINEIKNKVSYDTYKHVLAVTSNFTDLKAAKLIIESFCSNNNINAAEQFPVLSGFLSLKQEALNLNPVAMVKEERSLIDRIRTYLSESQTELEVAYIADFKEFYKNYITAQLTSSQWEYVKIGLEKFEDLYAKYSVMNDVAKLQKYSSLLSDFYNVNTERNTIFLTNMGILGQSSPTFSSVILSDSEGSRRSAVSSLSDSVILSEAKNLAVPQPSVLKPQPSLFSAKKILILVSGGYHTEGVTKILNQNNISNITITPEVINVAATTRQVYETLVAQQAMSLRQMIALGLMANAATEDQISAVVNSMLPNQALDNININEFVNNLNKIFGEKISFSLLPAEHETPRLEVTLSDGTKQIIDISEAAASVISEQNIAAFARPESGFKFLEGKKLRQIAEFAKDCTLNGGRGIFAPQIYKISKNICIFMVNNKWYLGDGVVYDIATSDKYDGQSLDGIEPVIYEYMPGAIQQALSAAEAEKGDKKEAADNETSPVLKKLSSKSGSTTYLFTRALALVLAFVMTLTLAACSLFNGNPKYSGNSSFSSLTSEQQNDFDRSILDRLSLFDAGNGRYHSFSQDGMTRRITADSSAEKLCNLYDQALAALMSLQTGDIKQADRILNTINKGNNGNLSKSNLPGEEDSVTGETVWAGIAAVQFKLATGSDKYDWLISKVDNWLSSKKIFKNGAYGYYGDKNRTWISSEHMVDIIMYYNLKMKYDDSEELRENLKSAATFFYDNLYDGGIKRGFEDTNRTLDSYAWTIQMLLILKKDNPAIYRSSGLSRIKIKDLFERIEKVFGTSVDGYSNLYKWSSTSQSVSFEWSLQVAIAYAMTGDTEKAEAIKRDCINYSQSLGAKSGMVVYTNENDSTNYYPDGWKVFQLAALCTLAQLCQLEKGTFFDSASFNISKTALADWHPSDLPGVAFDMSEDLNWRSYPSNIIDISNIKTIKFKIRQMKGSVGANVRIQFLPKNLSLWNWEGTDFGSVKGVFSFDDSGNLEIEIDVNGFLEKSFGTTNKLELEKKGMGLSHVSIVISTGEMYFRKNLNPDNDTEIDVESVEIEYKTEESVPSAILPKTFKKINKLIASGSATTLNILKNIIKAETAQSLFRPISFIFEHAKGNRKGAALLSAVTILSEAFAALKIFGVVQMWMMFPAALTVWSVGSLAVSVVAYLLIPFFANVITHILIDLNFIQKTEPELSDKIEQYGKDNVSFNDDGTISVSNLTSSQPSADTSSPSASLSSDSVIPTSSSSLRGSEVTKQSSARSAVSAVSNLPITDLYSSIAKDYYKNSSGRSLICNGKINKNTYAEISINDKGEIVLDYWQKDSNRYGGVVIRDRRMLENLLKLVRFSSSDISLIADTMELFLVSLLKENGADVSGISVNRVKAEDVKDIVNPAKKVQPVYDYFSQTEENLKKYEAVQAGAVYFDRETNRSFTFRKSPKYTYTEIAFSQDSQGNRTYIVVSMDNKTGQIQLSFKKPGAKNLSFEDINLLMARYFVENRADAEMFIRGYFGDNTFYILGLAESCLRAVHNSKAEFSAPVIKSDKRYAGVLQYYVQELIRTGRVHIPVVQNLSYGSYSLTESEVADFINDVKAAVSAFESDIEVSVANRTKTGFDLYKESKSVRSYYRSAADDYRRSKITYFNPNNPDAYRSPFVRADWTKTDRRWQMAAILPETFNKINDLISLGSATTLNILKTILQEETLFSLFNPISFFRAHKPKTDEAARINSENSQPSTDAVSRSSVISSRLSAVISSLSNTEKGAALLSAVTIAAYILSSALFLTFIFTFPGINLVTGAYAFITALLFPVAANITAHAVIDFRYIKSSGILEAIALYGEENVRFNSDGTVSVTNLPSPLSSPRASVGDLASPSLRGAAGDEAILPSNPLSSSAAFKSIYVINDIPKNVNAKDFSFKPVPTKIQTEDENGKTKYVRCWLGKYKGIPVIYAPGANYETIVSEYRKTKSFRIYSGDGGTIGTQTGAAVDVIEIDMVHPNRPLGYSQYGNAVVGLNFVTTDGFIDTRKEKAGIVNNNINTVTVNQNIAFYIDNPGEPKSSADLIEQLKIFSNKDGYLGTDIKVLFPKEYIDSILSLLENEVRYRGLIPTEKAIEQEVKKRFAEMLRKAKEDFHAEIIVYFETPNATDTSSPSSVIPTSSSSLRGAAGDEAILSSASNLPAPAVAVSSSDASVILSDSEESRSSAVSQPSADLSSPNVSVGAPAVVVSNLQDYGLFSYIWQGQLIDSVTSSQTPVKIVTDLSDIKDFGSISVLKISDVKENIEESSGIFAFLNSALNISEIMKSRGIEFVKQAASNFSFDQVPYFSFEELQAVAGLEQENKFESLFSALQDYEPVKLYYDTLQSPEERQAFAEAIFKRILAVNWLKDKNIKYGLKDHKLEVLLADALYQSVISSTLTPQPSDDAVSRSSDSLSSPSVSTTLSSSNVSVGDLAVGSSSAPQLLSSSAAVDSFALRIKDLTASQAEQELKKMLSELTQRAFNNEDPDSEAINDIIALIPVYAEPNIELRNDDAELINTGVYKNILAAA